MRLQKKIKEKTDQEEEGGKRKEGRKKSGHEDKRVVQLSISRDQDILSLKTTFYYSCMHACLQGLSQK